MNPGVMVIITLATFLVLLFLGFPVAFVLFGTAVVFIMIFVGPKALYSVYAASLSASIKETFMAIPLFIFMATVFVYSGVGEQMYDMMYKWFAGVRGGLGIGTVILCTMIAAITGIGSTGVVTIGLFAFPEMERRGYSRMISLGCIPAGGTLGPIIPPSVFYIIVGAFSEQSVGKMFMGGVFPGLLMALFFIIYIAVLCWIRPSYGPVLPLAERASWPVKFKSLAGVILPIILILLVLGTIYLGVATPTEAGGVGAVGALFVAAINRRLNLKLFKETTMRTFRINAMIMWIIMGGVAFGAFFGMTGLGKYVQDFILGLPLNPIGVVAIMIIIPLILGMFMDAMPIVVVFLPVFVPIIWSVGLDSLWFSLLFAIALIIGYVTPPFGMALFFTKGIVPPDVQMIEIYRAVIPFAVLMIIVLFIGVFWPPLMTWLPSMMVTK